MLLDVKQLKAATLDLHRAAERHVRILGAAYVIEGSTLGGAFVRSRLKLDVPTAFLAGYRDQTGPMWRRFVTIVEAARVDAEAAVAGARAMFRTLIDWLDEPAREAPQPFRGLVGAP